MAHHSELPGLDPKAAKEAEDRQKKLEQEFRKMLKGSTGPTGLFPEGKAALHDEGEIAIAVGGHSGKVFIEFGKEISSLGMTPQQAMSLANLLIKQARGANIIGKSKEPLTLEI